MEKQINTTLKTKLPILVAVLLLIPIYILPIWWVSLTAPNYPKEAFPDGVKIHFHMDGVFNGCEVIEKAEKQVESLDCVYEMDTINHYVGMYPIAAGGPIEIFLSIFLLTIVGIMLLGYLIDHSKKRMIFLSVGFALITLWLSMTLYAPNGIRFLNASYLSGRVAALGHESDDFDEEMTAAESLIASLKSSLEKSGVEVDEKEAKYESQKEKDIAYLKDAFHSNQKSLGFQEEWKGQGLQLLRWHYRTSLARYFNDPVKIEPMINAITKSTHLAFAIVIGLMGILLIGARKTNGLFHYGLAALPITLPGIFVLIYSIWLGWYGHNMNDMGAFTLKPFMPTVFGQGKVAQFTTNSYPHIGFFVMLLFSVLLIYALLAKRNHNHEIAKQNTQ